MAVEARWPIELLAYAAGVIDSDGSIQIRLDTYAMRVRKLDTGPIYKERVTVGQIEPAAVQLFKESFGGSCFLLSPPPSKPRSMPIYRWQIADRAAARLLEAILPHLRIKRRQAEVCLELRRLKDLSRAARFAPGRGLRGAGPRPPELSLAMAELRAEIGKLNHHSTEMKSAEKVAGVLGKQNPLR